MKKVLLIVVASAALIAVVPATALAKHGDRRHHHRGHHHAQVQHRTFGHDEGNQNNNTPAGTVVSFTNGVLKIMSNDGNTASGTVTNATELRCEQPEPAEMQNHDRGRGGDGGGDNNRGGDNDRGDDQGDDQGDDDNDEANEMCTTADLTTGAVVQKAELRISNAGAVWDEVELVSQSSQSSHS